MDDRIQTLDANERLIAVFAFRYALGRQTYAPGVVAEHITRHLASFPEHERRQLTQEIDRAEEDGMLGDACDAAVWRGLRATLQEG